MFKFKSSKLKYKISFHEAKEGREWDGTQYKTVPESYSLVIFIKNKYGGSDIHLYWKYGFSSPTEAKAHAKEWIRAHGHCY